MPRKHKEDLDKSIELLKKYRGRIVFGNSILSKDNQFYINISEDLDGGYKPQSIYSMIFLNRNKKLVVLELKENLHFYNETSESLISNNINENKLSNSILQEMEFISIIHFDGFY